MKQAIAGVTPFRVGEATIMIVWPSIASTWFGRMMGRLYRIKAGIGFVTLGNLIALASAPLMAMAILGKFIAAFVAGIPLLGLPFRLLPNGVIRYILTNRRVIIARGLKPAAEQYVELDRFDDIEVVVQPGQEWYPAGDLVFKRGAVETFLLRGVLRPETFRQTCLKARQAYVGVKQAMELVQA
jgi:MFS family permease